MPKFIGFTTDDKSDREIREWLREKIGWRENMNLVIFDTEPGIDYKVMLIARRAAKDKKVKSK